MIISIDENIPLLGEALTTHLPAGFAVQKFHGRNLSSRLLQNSIAVCVRSTSRINAEILEGTPVRFVGTATSGTEHIDIPYLRASKRFFHDARGSNAHSVAEYVVTAILLWAEHTQTPLENTTIGILGYGHIGRRVAELTHWLGMRILVSDPPLRAATTDQNTQFCAEYCRETSLYELCSQSNIITNHIPFTQEPESFPTLHLFDRHTFEYIQHNSLFIHTSRGGITDEQALLDAIHTKRLSAAVDVWKDEPRVNTALAERCLLATPHIAGYSYDAKVRGAEMIAEGLEKFFRTVLYKDFPIDWAVFRRAREEQASERINLRCLSDNGKKPLPQHSQKILLAHLRRARCLEGDTAKFLASLKSVAPEIEFDNLRKYYPTRREVLCEDQ